MYAHIHKDRKQARERESERGRDMFVSACVCAYVIATICYNHTHTQNYTIDVCVGTFFAHTQAQYIYIA